MMASKRILLAIMNYLISFRKHPLKAQSYQEHYRPCLREDRMLPICLNRNATFYSEFPPTCFRKCADYIFYLHNR